MTNLEKIRQILGGNRFGAKFAVIGISKKDMWTINGLKNEQREKK